MKRNFQYFVEGECEKVLVNALIRHFNLIPPGKLRVLNICQKIFPDSLLFSLKPNSTVVFIFDTDVASPDVVVKSIKKVMASTTGVDVIVIPQNRNLEDELRASCRIREIRELTNSKSNKNFKTDFVRASNVGALLENVSFDFSRLWTNPLDDKWSLVKRGDIHKCK